MCLIFSFDFLAEQKFRKMTDTIFVDIDTVSVWHTLTMRVHEYILNYDRHVFCDLERTVCAVNIMFLLQESRENHGGQCR